jgi:hypothetical protein
VLRAIGDRVELHITMTHEVVMSQQCGGPEQAYVVSKTWLSALIDRGWIEDPASVTLRPRDDRRFHRVEEDKPLSYFLGRHADSPASIVTAYELRSRGKAPRCNHTQPTDCGR